MLDLNPPLLGAQMNEQKQQLKHEHRDRLVEIGCLAIEHASRSLPENDQTRKIISERLEAVRRGDITVILSQARREIKKTHPHTQASRLVDATGELILLAASEKYLSGDALDWVLVPAYNSFVFVSDQVQRDEIAWQEKTLHPRVEESFKQLRDAEKNLKAA
jgi:hypothetical protein